MKKQYPVHLGENTIELIKSKGTKTNDLINWILLQALEHVLWPREKEGRDLTLSMRMYPIIVNPAGVERLDRAALKAGYADDFLGFVRDRAFASVVCRECGKPVVGEPPKFCDQCGDKLL